MNFCRGSALVHRATGSPRAAGASAGIRTAIRSGRIAMNVKASISAREMTASIKKALRRWPNVAYLRSGIALLAARIVCREAADFFPGPDVAAGGPAVVHGFHARRAWYVC